MRSLILFSALAGIFFGLFVPAEAGQRNRWRDCGGHTYEGCDGIQRGPYANRKANRNRNHAGFQNNFGQQNSYGQGYNKTTYKKTNYEMTYSRKVKVTTRKWHMRCDRNGCQKTYLENDDD